MTNDFLSPREVAMMLRVSPITVRSWANKGLLHAEVTPGGHRRFSVREVERLGREHGITLARNTAQKPLRILIVDDDPPFARYMLELLAGYTEASNIAVAYDGFEAGRKMTTFAPDVVLLDLMMPGLDGFEVCKRIKQDPGNRDARVIAVSGYLTAENVRLALASGAEQCLGKPLNVERLIEVIWGRADLNRKR